MYVVIGYGLKACREKVRQETGPKQERKRDAASRGWEKMGFCLIFTWTWDDIEVAICMFVLGSLWSEIVASSHNILEKGSLKWD